MKTREAASRRPKPVIKDLFDDEISVDLFAGGGGASVGTRAATGREVDIAINHDETAIAVHTVNHPTTEHYTADIFEIDPVAACRGRRVRHLHASPDCRHFSRAKGSKPVSDSVRHLADVVVDWARAVAPTLITLENVPEFVEWGPLLPTGKPDPKRTGEDFERWCSKLASLGYAIEHRVLCAHHFGAPTSRKRLFLVARRDGQRIRWPAPTHGPGLLPYRTAAEHIDFALPCPSIFGRKKPLAAATLRRIATGLMRFVIESPRPFVVGVGGRAAQSKSRTVDEPIGAITSKNDRALVTPTLVEVNHSGERRPLRADAPLPTITAERRSHALVAPMLVQTGYGERKGQRPRYLDLHQPLGAVMATGQKHALVSAFLAKHYGGVVGHGVEQPLGTITSVDHHSLVEASLAEVIDAEAYPHAREVLPFLITYYGSGVDAGQRVDLPLRTITTRDRFALVTVEIDGATYAIVDIGLRMLEPDPELLGCQFGEFAREYDLSAAKTKKAKTRLVGNSVCPHPMRALLAVNPVEPMRSAA